MQHPEHQQAELAAKGRLSAYPNAEIKDEPHAKGQLPLGLGAQRDGLLYVPKSYRNSEPAPLLVLLHGAGGNALNTFRWIQRAAADAGMIVLIPESREKTWDVLRGGFGPDVLFIDKALQRVAERYAIDPKRIAIGGFSDGASYALSLGLTNGNLFPYVLAFSPGFLEPAARTGMPHIFISHGTGDEVLPIDRCSRRIVPMLQRAGYTVEYVEFEGRHTIPLEVVRWATAWYLDREANLTDRKRSH